MAPRFFADHPKHFRFGSGQANIIAEAKQHGFGRSAFFDHDRSVFFHSAQQFTKPARAVNAETIMDPVLSVRMRNLHFNYRNCLQLMCKYKDTHPESGEVLRTRLDFDLHQFGGSLY